jgi:4-coumarate--CoA ligase
MPYVGYGLTEMSPVSHLQPYDKFLSQAGSVGILLPNLEARLVGDGDVDVKPGKPGELWLRGPTVMKVGLCGRIYNGPNLILRAFRVT